MDWKQLLAYITGSVEEELLLRNSGCGPHHMGNAQDFAGSQMQGLTDLIAPHLDRLRDAGMWMSEAIRQRVLALAGERLGK